MAVSIRPTLSSVPAFDAEFGTLGKEDIDAPIFKFSWKGAVSRKNRLVIRDYDSNTVVYDCTITTMALKHQLHNTSDESSKTQLVTYALENGHKYIANIYVYTSEEEASEASNDVIFYCYSTPTFQFTNFTTFIGDSNIAVANSSSVNFTVYYYQENNEPLNSYKFELRDYNGITLMESATKYSSLSEDILYHTIGGISETDIDKYGEIQTNRAYKIICSGETQHGIVVTIEQDFVVKLENSGVGALVRVENIGDGTVAIYSNYKIMNAEFQGDELIYENDENGNPYAIILKNGDSLVYNDGFIITNPYEVIIKGIFDVGKLLIFTNVDDSMAHISLNKIEYTDTPFYYFSFSIEQDGILHEVRTNYFSSDTESINSEIDLSYYNGFYNIKAKVNGEVV